MQVTDVKLTSEAVDALMRKCVSTAGIETRGIYNTYVFDDLQIAESAETIHALLRQLPDQFRAECGGGWSFLNACDDKDGNQWTGLHVEMEALFCLGIAAGKARWMGSRETWNLFPGGMPYVTVL